MTFSCVSSQNLNGFAQNLADWWRAQETENLQQFWRNHYRDSRETSKIPTCLSDKYHTSFCFTDFHQTWQEYVNLCMNHFVEKFEFSSVKRSPPPPKKTQHFWVPFVSQGLQSKLYVFGHWDLFCLSEDTPTMCLSLVSFVWHCTIFELLTQEVEHFVYPNLWACYSV